VCLIGVHLGDRDSRFALILAANRDEAFARPTQPAHWRKNAGHWIFGGRDLVAGGAWMAFRDDGVWAALTNVREPLVRRSDGSATSRGTLVLEALAEPQRWLAEQRPSVMHEMAGFNLLVGSAQGIRIHSNRSDQSVWLPHASGAHAISNGVLMPEWPKTKRLRQALIDHGAQQNAPDALRRALLQALAHETQAPDHELPDTGVGLAMERLLSPALIRSEYYGTRVSTIATIERTGQVVIEEHSRHGPSTCRITQFRTP
jgi:uncharacterized protein with NRDE domain